MSVGILLVTHEGVGSALLDVASRLLRKLPLTCEAFEVGFDADPDTLAAQLARLGTPVRRVSALNLPMLLRVMNYADLPLDELPAVAAAGARNGAITDDA